MKQCKRCQRYLAPGKFRRYGYGSEGRRLTCYKCELLQKRKSNLAPGKTGRPPSSRYEKITPDLRQRAIMLWHKYRIEISDYERLLEQQKGKCAICGGKPSGRGAPKYFHIDHDAESGLIRGLLCGGCNMGMGYFRHDPDALREAARYLEKVPLGV